MSLLIFSGNTNRTLTSVTAEAFADDAVTAGSFMASDLGDGNGPLTAASNPGVTAAAATPAAAELVFSFLTTDLKVVPAAGDVVRIRAMGTETSDTSSQVTTSSCRSWSIRWW